MYDKRQDIKDKVPIFGDIPIIGRTFRSTVSQSEKKNVIFFVSVRVIDPAGNRVNQAAQGAAAAAR
jgi:general secretion pathway protein D